MQQTEPGLEPEGPEGCGEESAGQLGQTEAQERKLWESCREGHGCSAEDTAVGSGFLYFGLILANYELPQALNLYKMKTVTKPTLMDYYR